ncbi:hypothetical protein HOC37_04040 [bacterium]|jgi:hypothetical protein|nr:hypothetical protein [bacterium]MBT4552139.1 hypothetical protein [bacterium]MBT7087644.1 hypothetical protein [bacterium]
MKVKILWCGIFLLSIFLCQEGVFAETQLSFEDLLTAQHRWTIETSVNYLTTVQDNVTSITSLIQLADNLFLPIQIPIIERTNTNIILGSLGIKYGVSAATELSFRGSALKTWNASSQATDNVIEEEDRYNDAWLGITHRIFKEDNIPSLFTFLEFCPIEKYGFAVDSETKYAFIYGKSWNAGAMLYKTIDPIVLSLSLGYQLNLARKKFGTTVNPGEVIYINPSINFAINNELTLFWGVNWTNQQASKINHEISNIEESTLKYEFGLGYQISEKMVLHISSDTTINSDDTEASFIIKSSYKI